MRAIIVGMFLGVAYGFITMRFALGPFGVVPTFNMPMGELFHSLRGQAGLQSV